MSIDKRVEIPDAQIDYSRLPEHMRAGFRRWIELGVDMGDFGMAVVEGNLFQAFMFADDTNRLRMFDFVWFLINKAPNGCYGSRAKVEAWRESHARVRA